MLPSVDQQLKLAKEYLAKGDTGAAEDLFRQILSQFPKDQAALAGLKNLVSPAAKRQDTNRRAATVCSAGGNRAI